MNSDAIYEIIEEISATPSKNAKEATVRLHAGDAEFRRVLLAALDPGVTYGLEQIPDYKAGPHFHDGTFDETTWNFLNQLAKRELTGNAAKEVVAAKLAGLTEKGAELLKRIITKDLRAGFGESTVNKAIPGLIPAYPYMRCSLPKEAKLEGGRRVLAREGRRALHEFNA